MTRHAAAFALGVAALAAVPGVRAQPAPPPDTASVFEASAPIALPPATAPLDTTAVASRPIPTRTLERFRDSPRYQYDGPSARLGPSPMERLWTWFKRVYIEPVLRRLFSEPGQTGLTVLAFILLVALVLWLVGKGGGELFARRAGRAEAGVSEVLLDVARIEDVDLAALLARARAEGRFRDATRFRFLLGLQRLAAAGLIVWEPHKTDGDYLREVRRHARPALTDAFAGAARVFAWVWYGEQPLDAARFAHVENRLDRLDAALHPRAA